MAIFPSLNLELLVQVNDKTRLDARRTYVSSDEAPISLIEIESEAGAGFIDITSNQYYDYQYSSDGAKVVTLRVTTDGAPVTETATVSVVTEADDRLFSSDQDLVSHEPDILNWIRDGRNTFKDISRLSQSTILTYLDEHRVWKNDGTRLEKDDIFDIKEVQDWSKYQTLTFIFEGLSNDINDIFAEKSRRYREMLYKAQQRSVLRLDTDQDGNIDNSIDLRSYNLVRR